MKKKLLSILLATVMAFSVCACGNEEVQESKESGQSTQQTTEVAVNADAETDKYPIVEEPITIKAVFVGTVEKDDSRKVWDKVSEVTGINIEWEIVDGEAINTYLAGNDWPDFIHANLSSSLVYDYGVLGGRFVNYLDYLDVMPNLVQAFEDYPSARAAFTESNGEMYKLPGIEVSATKLKTKYHGLSNVLEEAGVAVPTTVEEFAQALRDLKAYYGTYSWIPNLTGNAYTWGHMIYAAFGTDTNMVWNADDDGNVVYAGTTEQMRHYYEYMNSLYEEGLIHPECATMDGTMKKELELSGKVAFLETAQGSVTPDENGDYHIICIPPLTSEYDDTQVTQGVLPIYNNFSAYVNAESEYVEEICKMLDIAYATEEVVEGSGLHGASFCYGIEGEDWYYDGDGTGTYSLIAPDEYDGSFSTYQYNEVIYQNMGRCTAFEGLITSTAGNSQARQKAYVEGIHPYVEDESDVFPADFLKFNDDQQYVIESKWSEIQTYAQKMRIEFITGVTDIETGWDTYVKTLDQMGLSDVVQVYQEAYDVWCNN